MRILKSNKSYDLLSKTFDERTSEARFAGNDELLDDIFITHRSGDKFTVVRKAKSIREPFATVFHGRLVCDGECSFIKGYFTKHIIDYIISAILFAFIIVIRNEVLSRGEPSAAINIIAAMYLLLVFLLMMTFKNTKDKYIDFLKDITE